jgi:hypothetical protein
MPSSAQTVLNDLLDHERTATAPEFSPSSFFELFSASQVLKNYGLSYDEIQAGIIDARGGDGGIDAIYTFVNGALVTEDMEFATLRQNALVTLVVIQAKTETGFSDEPILRIERTIKQLFDISHDPNQYSRTYNSQLISAVTLFQSVYCALLTTSPQLQISFYYTAKADYIHPNVQDQAEALKLTVKHLFSESNVDFNFLGAEQLLALYRKAKVETIPLQVAQAMQTPTLGTVCLIQLRELFDFIRDPDTGELRAWLFEENIRDYEGKDIEVNKGIRQTLLNPTSGQEFWWLNNGLTIVASKAPRDGNTLTIRDPKIVNGLQTSMEIYNFFHIQPDTTDTRTILVRVIVTDIEQTRNDIIRATNTQSPIQATSLRAFDPIHHLIEQHFTLHGWFYERRKNFYKNQGKPRDKIITISYLAQAVAAIVLQKPNDSRGRPTTLVKKSYDKVFNDNYPISMYLECIKFMKAVEAYLGSTAAPDFVKGHELNVKYHLAMFSAAIKAKRLHITPQYVSERGLGEPDTELLTKCLKHVWGILQAMRGPTKDIDESQIAKSPDFDSKLHDRIRSILRTRRTPL